jgi:hypothetical protein
VCSQLAEAYDSDMVQAKKKAIKAFIVECVAAATQ